MSSTQNAGPVLDLLIIAYGSSADDPAGDSRFYRPDQRRVEVKLAPRAPVSAAGDLRRMHEWSQGVLRNAIPDVKHSQRWHCEFCDKLARESQMNVASWMHLTPPRLVVYLHLVCDTQKGRCAKELRKIEKDMAAMTGHSPQRPPVMPRGNAVFPAAASCTKCEREETVDQDLSRCSRCKLARYCGVDCQRSDWTRHKETCKVIQDVKWVWP